jgi:Ca2+-binding EF-hand superfamily protein
MSTSDIEKQIELLKAMFKKFDKDGNGTIEKSELRDTMRQELFIPVSEKDVDEMIKEADANGDGIINYEEFTTIMKNYFEN